MALEPEGGERAEGREPAEARDQAVAELALGLGELEELDRLAQAVGEDRALQLLERDGVAPYPGSVLLLDHLRSLGLPLAVVSSSVNAPAVLEAAGLSDRFQTVVSGAVAKDLGLPGKPAPDTFVHAAEVLGATAATSVVLEDAVSGVRAGAAGHFGAVVGVDRGAGPVALVAAGATIVVQDLAELVPGGAE